MDGKADRMKQMEGVEQNLEFQIEIRNEPMRFEDRLRLTSGMKAKDWTTNEMPLFPETL